MTTRISDIIVPEVFNPYMVERTAELSALYQSGIISASPELDRLASSGGRLLNMPYWHDLSGDDEVLSDTNPLTPDKITAGQDVAVLHLRGKAWAANDLAKALSGDDPMRAIADLVAAYWARQWQKLLIASLKGVFASPSMAQNVHEADVFNGKNFLDASYKLGDAEERLTALAVHSATYASMRKQDLIEFIPDSQGKPIPYYMGKRVIVDDGLPVEDDAGGKIYTTYIFGDGAIGYGEGGAPVPTETDRDSLQGDDILINRRHFILHPRGVKFTDSSVAGAAPTNAELENPNNWERVYEPKNVRIVAFKHKVGNEGGGVEG